MGFLFRPLRRYISLTAISTAIFTSLTYASNLSRMKSVRSKTSRATSSSIKLEGQLLIAMPSMQDRRFQRSVIYLCAHSEEGAMGLIINQRANHISAPDLLQKLGISPRDRDDQITSEVLSLSVQVGGPVETGRGFVLHSSDYFSEDSTLAIEKGVCLTATIDILKAIAQGRGPQRAMLALGYAGWSPGQLEDEIQSNGWLHCPGDPDLVFDDNLETKYPRALAQLGVDISHLVSDAGHA